MKVIFSFSIMLFCFGSIFGQELNFRKHSVGVHFEHFYGSKLLISQPPHMNSDGILTGNGLYSFVRLMNNAGSIYYKRHLNESSALGVEFFAGRDNSSFRVQMDQEFLDHGIPEDGLVDAFLANKINPFGLSLFYSHSFRIGNSSFFDLSAGISGVYSVPDGGSQGRGVFLNGDLHYYLLHDYETNPRNRVIPALYLSVSYNYDITPLIGVRAGALIRHSNSTILASEVPYRIIGQEEVITGTYRKKFSQFGWRFGFYFNFGS